MGFHGTDMHGNDYEIVISYGRTFRAYDCLGFERLEVCVEDGVITMSQFIPDEMNQWQARTLAAMLMAASYALEASDPLDRRGCGATLGEDAE